MNQDDYKCFEPNCRKNLLGMNWGVLNYQWTNYQKYWCYKHTPPEELLKRAERQYKRVQSHI